MERKLVSKFKTLETNDATCADVSKRNFMSIGIQKDVREIISRRSKIMKKSV